MNCMKESFICAKKNKRKISILIATVLLCGNACFLNGEVTLAANLGDESIEIKPTNGKGNTIGDRVKDVILIGDENTFEEKANGIIVIGKGNTIERGTQSDNTVIEDQNNLIFGNSNTMGWGATNSIILGNDSKTGWHNTNQIAIGNKVEANRKSALAIGNNVKAGENAISLGTWDKMNDEVEVEAPEAGANSISIGHNTSATAEESVALGDGTQVKGKFSTAIGYQATAIGINSIAAGDDSISHAHFSVALGSGAQAGVKDDDGRGSIAIGPTALAFGTGAIAQGDNAHAYTKYSIAIGDHAEVGTKNDYANDALSYGIAIGKDAKAQKNGVVLGYQAQVTDENDVAIGAGSITNAVNGVRESAKENSNESYVQFLQQEKNFSFAGDKPNGLFSIGSDSLKRRLINVAAGRISADSTDAVNGSQLYWTWKSLNDKIDGIVIKGDINITVDKGNTSGGQTGEGSTGSGETGSGSTETGVISPKWDIKLNDEVTLGNESDGKLTVKNKEGTNQVTITNGTVVASGNISAGSFSTGNITINKGGKNTINGLSNTTWDSKNYTSGQAATEDQLKQVDDKVEQNSNAISQMWNQNMSLNARMDEVGAGAAALAGLHPLDFDPDDKFSIAAAMGRYHGESAWALGMYYQPNDDLLFSTSSTINYDHNMYNFGVSLKLGHSQTYQKLNRAGMAAELSRLSEENRQMKKENEILKAENQDIRQKLEQIMKKLGLK